jgi:hypothetical protein
VDNPFNQVVNSQKNRLVITFNNKGTSNYTIHLVNVRLTKVNEPDQTVRNVSSVRFNLFCPAMGLVEIPSTFYNEMNPQELNLNAEVLFTDQDGTSYRGVGFDNVVSIVDPEHSLFDMQMLFLYFIMLAVFGGVGYLIFQAFVGDVKSKKKRAPAPKPAEQSGSATGKEYDEGWIPEHHFKSQKSSSPRMRKKDKKGSS